MVDAVELAVVMVTLPRHPAGSSLRTFARSVDETVSLTTKVTLLVFCFVLFVFRLKPVVAGKLNNWTQPTRRSTANGM